MNRPKISIIGNGMATARLLDELSRRNGLRRFDVSVFGEEPHGSYNRILLGRVLGGGGMDEITLKPASWYASAGVQFFAGRKVTRVSPGVKRLWTDDGREHYFDRVVFATGSVARVPDVEGMKRPDGSRKEGVFAYRTADDVERMLKLIRPGRNAVVVGGGLLGLEAAKSLSDLGLGVTVVHLFDVLMNRQVDRIGGEFLRRAIEKLGIIIKTSATTKAIRGADRVEGLELGGGEVLPADMVVFASGIMARVDLAQESDIPVNAGIIVNDSLATRVGDVFAVGECAEHRGKVYGTVQPIYEQCEVLADILTGANPDSRYLGSEVYTKLKVAGVEVASMGSIEGHDSGDESIQIVEEKRGAYRKLVVRDDRLVGAVLVGDSSAAAGLVRALDDGSALPANRLDLLASGEGVAGSADPEICNCHHVTSSTLVSAIRNGCDTLSSLSNRTRAGTGCGSCRGQLANLILTNAAAEVGGGKGSR